MFFKEWKDFDTIFASVCEPKQKVKCSKLFTGRVAPGFGTGALGCNLKSDSFWAGVINSSHMSWYDKSDVSRLEQYVPAYIHQATKPVTFSVWFLH